MKRSTIALTLAIVGAVVFFVVEASIIQLRLWAVPVVELARLCFAIGLLAWLLRGND